MLTIENTYKIIDVPIVSNRVVEYYIKNTTEFAGAYQIHLRCPRKSKSDELIMLYRTPQVVGLNNEMTYTMNDNSNPMNRIYLLKKDIKDVRRFISSIEFFITRYILC